MHSNSGSNNGMSAAKYLKYDSVAVWWISLSIYLAQMSRNHGDDNDHNDGVW